MIFLEAVKESLDWKPGMEDWIVDMFQSTEYYNDIRIMYLRLIGPWTYNGENIATLKIKYDGPMPKMTHALTLKDADFSLCPFGLVLVWHERELM
jgi:hypothetical protein